MGRWTSRLVIRNGYGDVTVIDNGMGYVTVEWVWRYDCRLCWDEW